MFLFAQSSSSSTLKLPQGACHYPTSVTVEGHQPGLHVENKFSVGSAISPHCCCAAKPYLLITDGNCGRSAITADRSSPAPRCSSVHLWSSEWAGGGNGTGLFGTRKGLAPEKCFCKQRNFKALQFMKIKPYYMIQIIHLAQNRNKIRLWKLRLM